MHLYLLSFIYQLSLGSYLLTHLADWPGDIKLPPANGGDFIPAVKFKKKGRPLVKHNVEYRSCTRSLGIRRSQHP